ncbi:MAG: FAD/NAD(P)-binding protein [Paracoccaceae bacterium]
MNAPPPAPPTVAIIGGGFSGATVAFHLAWQTGADEASIVVIEPRADLGRGLAYSTPDPAHRLNVPDHKMTLRTDEPQHFRRWLASPSGPLLPAGSATQGGEIFAPRAVFGDYVKAQLAPLLASGAVRHLQTRATAVRRIPGGFGITLGDGSVLTAQLLVLAVSHPPPTLPRELAGMSADAALIPDAYVPGALEAIEPQESVLVIGSGLTGADIVATLQARGHRGPVHMLSRHGRRSQPHGPAQAETAEDFSTAPEVTARALLRRIRRALHRDAGEGLTWHAAFDRLRAQGPVIWRALPLAEQRRLVRHLRGLWDVHRFRIAPQTHAAVEAMVAAGRLHPQAGRIVATRREGSRIAVEIRPRHYSQAPVTLTVDRIVLATGPGHSGVTETHPLLSAMAREGLVAADPLRLGLATASDGRAINAEGAAQSDLLVAGPLARAAVGELMGLPEVTAWAEGIAGIAAAWLYRAARQSR